MKSLLVVVSAVVFLGLTSCQHHKGHKNHDEHKDHKKMDHHAKMWETMDADKDGTVTKKEFEAAHMKKFDSMDANKDGKITKEEKMQAHKDKMKSEEKACCQ